MHASIYNVMPLAGVEKMVAFMKDFQLKHGKESSLFLPILAYMSKGLFQRSHLLEGSGKQEETSGSTPEILDREKLLTQQPELLQQFGIDLLPVLIQIYGSSVNAPVRHKCLSVIGKLMYFSQRI
ncbi:hypothetical protein L6452_06511 [Arctium lappa]|uniref:Uncharacterized protein n=1 Tax=Arctium lappa TaxID=4217 RepID=A0ACB9EK15_ARCLA|nr:hypothetical protein L6452_06511 [Arctium lappa]